MTPRRQDQTDVNPGFTLTRRKRPPRYCETIDRLAFVRRILRASGKRLEEGDISELRALVAIRQDLEATIVCAVDGLRASGVTWAEIGSELGLTKQGAYQYFGPRLRSAPLEGDSL